MQDPETGGGSSTSLGRRREKDRKEMGAGGAGPPPGGFTLGTAAEPLQNPGRVRDPSRQSRGLQGSRGHWRPKAAAHHPAENWGGPGPGRSKEKQCIWVNLGGGWEQGIRRPRRTWRLSPGIREKQPHRHCGSSSWLRCGESTSGEPPPPPETVPAQPFPSTGLAHSGTFCHRLL